MHDTGRSIELIDNGMYPLPGCPVVDLFVVPGSDPRLIMAIDGDGEDLPILVGGNQTRIGVRVARPGVVTGAGEIWDAVGPQIEYRDATPGQIATLQIGLSG